MCHRLFDQLLRVNGVLLKQIPTIFVSQAKLLAQPAQDIDLPLKIIDLGLILHVA